MHGVKGTTKGREKLHSRSSTRSVSLLHDLTPIHSNFRTAARKAVSELSAKTRVPTVASFRRRTGQSEERSTTYSDTFEYQHAARKAVRELGAKTRVPTVALLEGGQGNSMIE